MTDWDRHFWHVLSYLVRQTLHKMSIFLFQNRVTNPIRTLYLKYKVKFGAVFCLVFFGILWFWIFYSCSVPFYAKLVLRYTWSGWDCLKLRFFFRVRLKFKSDFPPQRATKKSEFYRPTHGIFFLSEPYFGFFSLKNC